MLAELAIDSSANDFRGHVVSLDAHRLLDASNHPSATIGWLVIAEQAAEFRERRLPRHD